MVGLGNGRRSMKSPPLILVALVACVIVLGFNYWIASSRSVELQTRIVELEGRVRRAAAERGAVELKKNEFQGELQKQREQLDRIQSSHIFQMENVNRLHQGEKARPPVPTALYQLKALQRSYGILQQDIFQFQKNQSSMEMKFAYDLSQCINQMKEVKEQCEERIEEATQQRNEAAVSRDVGEKNNHQQQELKPQPRPQQVVPPKEQTPQGKEDVARNNSQTPAPRPEALKPHKQNEEAEVQAGSKEHGLGPHEASVQEQAAPVSGTVGGAGKLQSTQVPAALLARPQKDSQYPERYQLAIQEEQKKQLAAEEERKLQNPGDDYSMEENEAESERDKQAALAGGDTYVLNAEDQRRGPENLPNWSEKQSLIQNQVEVHIPQQA
ncbi:Golm1 [Phodopus roborovskii]|uniref:Golm1 protein n=1 Tax=Phodopus roborovskii TaxID=109678 RepID=A0AAU9ZPG8_PHORO|nr:Golm1 [Phodopus roborovskii]